MTNKIISKLIRGVLLLETQLRGPRIKYSAWRAKIIKSQYIQSHCAYPIRKVPPVVEAIADTHRKAAYLIMLKAAYTSIGGTFFENESHRETYKQWANEAYTLGIDLLPLGIVTDKKPGHLFPLNNIKIIINSEKGWLMNGKNIEGNFKQKNITLDEVNSYFVFTFVRNPFTRLVSFSKIYIPSKMGNIMLVGGSPSLIFGCMKFHPLVNSLTKPQSFRIVIWTSMHSHSISV